MRRRATWAIVAALLACATPAQATQEVVGTSVTFEWELPTGPLLGHRVLVSRNGAPLVQEASTILLLNRITVKGQIGDEIAVAVRPFSYTGEPGPISPTSETVRFVTAITATDPPPSAGDPSPPPEPDPQPDPDLAVGTPFDLDGDGMSDLLVQKNQSGAVALWSMDAAGFAAATAIADQGRGGVIVGNGDYDGDGTSDILWRDTASGRLTIAYMEAGQVNDTAVIHNGVGNSWEIVGSADYDGDGLTDILFHNTGNNAFERWSISGSRYAGTPLPKDFGADAEVIASGDFDGDGMADVLWRDSASGEVDIWGATQDLAFGALEAGGLFGWSIIGAGDFDGDGRHDLLLRKNLGDFLAVRLAADGSRQQIQSPLNQSKAKDTRDVVGIGDYDGDGRTDLVVEDGETSVWYMNGAASPRAATIPRTGWSADFANVDWRKPGSR